MRRLFENGRGHYLLLGLLLAYGAAMSLLRIDYNSVFIDEAYHIMIGRQLLAGVACPGCPFATGAVTLHPVAAALGDALGGITGARLLNVALGLLLTAIVYATGRTLFDRRRGLVAAVVFMFAGQTLYLMKLATYDMLAAFFLGAALFLVAAARRADEPRAVRALLASAAAALFLASATKYLLPVFVPAFVAWVLLDGRLRRSAAWFILPLALLSVYFLFLSRHHPSLAVIGQIEDVRTTSHTPAGTLFDWIFRWVALFYLFAVFGAFHPRYGRTAVLLAALSTPIVLVHLVTGAEQSVNKNVIYAMIFLAPAAAPGIERLAWLFSMRSDVRAVRRAYLYAVLVIVWVFGFSNLRWLERQYPDVRPVIEFFDEHGFDGMTVAINGWDGVIYEYALGERFPRARFVYIEQAVGPVCSGADGRGAAPPPATRPEADFILCEDLYYGKICPCSGYREIFEDRYLLVERFTIEHSWGTSDASIFGRI